MDRPRGGRPLLTRARPPASAAPRCAYIIADCCFLSSWERSEDNFRSDPDGRPPRPDYAASGSANFLRVLLGRVDGQREPRTASKIIMKQVSSQAHQMFSAVLILHVERWFVVNDQPVLYQVDCSQLVLLITIQKTSSSIHT